MSHVAKRQACYEDLFQLPEHVVGEILGGELYTLLVLHQDMHTLILPWAPTSGILLTAVPAA